MQPNLVKIGKLSRLHGIKGGLVLHLDDGVKPDTTLMDAVFLQVNSVPTPFFIESLKTLGKNMVVNFDTVSSMEEAGKLVNLTVYAEAKKLQKATAQKDYSGYELIDEKRGPLGKVKEVMELPGQRMFVVMAGSSEILLPCSEAFINKTDDRALKIFYNAPDGLIDLYLG